MNLEEEIRFRNNIMKRIRSGEKVSLEERTWLVTHRVFNFDLGPPFLNFDIIQLLPNRKYIVRLRIEKLNYNQRIIPIVVVPGGKGGIFADFPIVDLNGKATTKNVKMLGLLLDLNRNESTFAYRSEIGLIGICYECDYFDTKQQLNIRKSSNTGAPNFAMLRENISDNKVKYKCKLPFNNNFEDFAFSVEWFLNTSENAGNGSLI